MHGCGLTAQKRLVEAGFGLGLMPESSVEEELRLGTLHALLVGVSSPG
jgi:DNA-binding transcriptional LysR family regulator